MKKKPIAELKREAISNMAEALKMVHGEPLESGEILVYFFEYPQAVNRINKVLKPFGVRLRVRSTPDDGVLVRAEKIDLAPRKPK